MVTYFSLKKKRKREPTDGQSPCSHFERFVWAKQLRHLAFWPADQDAGMAILNMLQLLLLNACQMYCSCTIVDSGQLLLQSGGLQKPEPPKGGDLSLTPTSTPERTEPSRWQLPRSGPLSLLSLAVAHHWILSRNRWKLNYSRRPLISSLLIYFVGFCSFLSSIFGVLKRRYINLSHYYYHVAATLSSEAAKLNKNYHQLES